MEKHIPNLLAALWAFGFFVILLALSKMVRPEGKTGAAKSGFNGGEQSGDKPWIRMAARYQLLVAAATMFFLGILLLYPAVASFRQWLDEGRGIVALIAVGLFLGSLSIALAHAWMKGDLSWVKEREVSFAIKEDHGNPRERIS